MRPVRFFRNVVGTVVIDAGIVTGVPKLPVKPVAVTVVPPVAVTVPLMVAEVAVIDETVAGSVVTDGRPGATGHASVVKLRVAPLPVPAEFVAFAINV